MNDNIINFVNTIEDINKTYSDGNYDTQEATLDALMQSMVCEEINWRPSSKMIVVSTDAPYHSAGDGKFVGAYKPNDMRCHLTNSIYTPDQSLLYDYPSVSQINKVANEQDIAIVFAVLEKVKNTYEILSKQISTARTVELKNATMEKSQIVDTIKTQYLVSYTIILGKGIFLYKYIRLSEIYLNFTENEARTIDDSFVCSIFY